MLRAAFTSALHGPALQASHSKTAWLLRFSGATCPHAEHRCDVYAAGICSTRPEALCCRRAASSPHPLRLMPRLRPRFWATRTPGCSTVPRAVRVIAPRRELRCGSCRSAARCQCWPFRPNLCVGPLSRAFSFAIACFVRARRWEPRSARASRCCSTFNRFDLATASDWGHAAVHRSTTPPTPPHHGRYLPRVPSPGPAIGSGRWANATCQRPARSRVTR